MSTNAAFAMSSIPSDTSAAQISKGDAEVLCIRVNETMDALNNIIEAETRLVRAGKIREAAHLQAEKAEFARLYIEDIFAIQTHAQTLSLLIPAMVERTRKRHDSFRANLQANMSALEIARGVSEQIIKDVAEEVASKSTLNTYGNSGAMGAYRAAVKPISVDTAL